MNDHHDKVQLSTRDILIFFKSVHFIRLRDCHVSSPSPVFLNLLYRDTDFLCITSTLLVWNTYFRV